MCRLESHAYTVEKPQELWKHAWESKVGLLMRLLTNTRRWFLTMCGLTVAFLFFFMICSTTYL